MAKQQKRKPQGPVVVTSHKPVPEADPWYYALDQAIEKQFPNVKACTTPTARTVNYFTTITMRDPDERLMPRQHRVISAFIAGFMACERSYYS